VNGPEEQPGPASEEELARALKRERRNLRLLKWAAGGDLLLALLLGLLALFGSGPERTLYTVGALVIALVAFVLYSVARHRAKALGDNPLVVEGEPPEG
jgi:multisubunit Na+/H+ antiporter MnhF subunit